MKFCYFLEKKVLFFLLRVSFYQKNSYKFIDLLFFKRLFTIVDLLVFMSRYKNGLNWYNLILMFL